MKVSKEESTYKPITITLETEKEYNFLLGLLNLNEHSKKLGADNYDKDLDQKLFDLLYEEDHFYY